MRRLVVFLLFLWFQLATAATPSVMDNERDDDDDPPLRLIDLPPELVSTLKAYCLDGSPYKYYFRKSSAGQQHEHDYVLYFQGGGWCSTMEDCRKRSLTNLGSSTEWAASLVNNNAPTLLHVDPYQNPLFAKYNHIFLPYCDGASFSGNQADPIDGLWFRGKHNLDAALVHVGLVATATTDSPPSPPPPTTPVHNLLVTGCSAGGLSVYLHSDDIRQRILDSRSTTTRTTKIKALAESGIFLFHDSVEGKPVYEDQMKQVFAMQNSTLGVNAECIRDHSQHTKTTTQQQPYQCLSAIATLHYLQTPIFIYNSIYDYWNIRCIYTAEPGGNCYNATGWHDCALDLANCTTPQRLAIWDWGDAVLQGLIMSGIVSPNRSSSSSPRTKNGAFLHSCFTHCSMDRHHDILHTLTIQGTTLGQAMINWWNDDDDDNYDTNQSPRLSSLLLSHPHVYWPCRIHTIGPPMCNPTCEAILGCTMGDGSSSWTTMTARNLRS